MRDEIIVYWSPSNFYLDRESWNMLYPDPENLYNSIVQKAKKDSTIHKCPALRDLNKNIYSFHSAVDDIIDFPDGLLLQVDNVFGDRQPLPLNSKVSLKKTRQSQHDGYVNLSYNMTWVMFAEEPLIAKFTAPYYPSTTPVPGAMLASGKFDIGQWFRNMNLDYQVPLDAKRFEMHKGDPMFFVEFETDKKVVLKRFTMNSVLSSVLDDVSHSVDRYGKRMTLQERYQMFKQSRSRDIVLREIKTNLLD